MTQRKLLILIWLATLLASARCLSVKQPVVRFKKSLFTDRYVIASELFRDSSLAYADIDLITGAPPEIEVDVCLVGKNSSINAKCSITLSADENAVEIGVSSLKRLAEKKILLTAFDRLKNGDQYDKLIWMDLSNCNFTFPMPELVLPKEHIILTGNEGDSYDIVIGNKTYCGPSNVNGRCLISKNETSRSIISFDVDFDWTSLYVEATSVENMLLVRGLDPFSTYKVMLYYTKPKNGDRKELLSLRFAEKTEVMSSDLAICWISEPGNDQSVKCLQYDVAGKLIFDKAISFQEPQTLLFVQNIRPGKILLITGPAKCNSVDCRMFYVTEVHCDVNGNGPLSMFMHVTMLECSNDRRRIVFSARKIGGAIVTEYACAAATDEFILGTITVADQ